MIQIVYLHTRIYEYMKLKALALSYGEQVFKALSDEARIRILHLMQKNGEMCISDIEHILDFTQTKTSRHMNYLKNAGLVSSRKVDQWVYYVIKEEASHIILQMFCFLEKDTTLLEDQKNYQTLYANNILAIRKLHNKDKEYKLPLWD